MNAKACCSRFVTLLGLVTLFGNLAVWSFQARAAEPAAGPTKSSTLHLANSDFAEGQLLPADDPKNLRWQAPAFTRPIDFPLERINAIHLPLPATMPKPEGEYCFEIGPGDFVYGQLAEVTADDVVIDSPRFGTLRIARAQVRRFFRHQGAEVVYMGPQGLNGWTDPGKGGAASQRWREVAGQPTTDEFNSSLISSFDLPTKAMIEVELSWQKKPDFSLAFGVTEKDITTAHAWRLEAWEEDLVILREVEKRADIRSVQTISTRAGRARLQIFLDQENDRLLAYSAGGTLLADLKVVPEKRVVGSKISLTNRRGDVRFERLRISQWNGSAPSQVEAAKTRLHRRDGTIKYGEIVSYDRTNKSLVIREGDEQATVPLDELTNVFVSPQLEATARPLRAVYLDGSQMSGEPVRWTAERLHMKCPGVAEPLSLPLVGLRSLVVTISSAAAPAQVATPTSTTPPTTTAKVKPAAPANGDPFTIEPLVEKPALAPKVIPPVANVAAPSGAQPAGHRGKLLLPGLQLHGQLVDGKDDGEATCLVWQPDGAVNASPLRRGASGSIVFREAPPPNKTVAAPAPTPNVVGQAIGFLNNLAATTKLPTGQRVGSNSLYLRSGDSFPYDSLTIDEKGVTFKTSVTETTFLPHSQLKAVEMVPPAAPLKLSRTKRERLLTLPRLQRDAPPTHLVRSTSGDFLRGNIQSLDAQKLVMEVRLEIKKLDRQFLSHIFWLHVDEIEQSGQKPVEATPPTNELRVQAVRGDGVRLTFVPATMDAGKLAGRSPWLGDCRVDLNLVDQLLIGETIASAASELPYHKWKLHRATDPKVVQGDDSKSPGTRTPGTESPLVGQAAPEFELPLVGGKRFRLAEQRGKVVVLDFWATWCGPCLQTMPQIERVVSELPKEANVSLVAVNLEETAKQVTAMLERHNLKQLTVALDEDGAVAAKYAATAIPQTVIIDRNGKVVRLFVGGGAKFGDQLRTALAEVLGDAKPAETPKPTPMPKPTPTVTPDTN